MGHLYLSSQTGTGKTLAILCGLLAMPNQK